MSIREARKKSILTLFRLGCSDSKRQNFGPFRSSSTDRRTFLLLTLSCQISIWDLSLNNNLFHSFLPQEACLLAQSSIFFWLASVIIGVLAATRLFKPKSWSSTYKILLFETSESSGIANFNSEAVMKGFFFTMFFIFFFVLYETFLLLLPDLGFFFLGTGLAMPGASKVPSFFAWSLLRVVLGIVRLSQMTFVLMPGRLSCKAATFVEFDRKSFGFAIST